MPIQPAMSIAGPAIEPVSGYTAESLEGMTVSSIKALADSLGYDITSTKKADIINEFLEQQNGSV